MHRGQLVLVPVAHDRISQVDILINKRNEVIQCDRGSGRTTHTGYCIIPKTLEQAA